MAGATTTASAQAPSSTWISPAYPGSQRSVTAGCPVIPVNVTAPTNRVAASVITTRTSAPAFTRARTSSTDL